MNALETLSPPRSWYSARAASINAHLPGLERERGALSRLAVYEVRTNVRSRLRVGIEQLRAGRAGDQAQRNRIAASFPLVISMRSPIRSPISTCRGSR